VTVEEAPAASWGPGLPPAIACYRIVAASGAILLETPDATERDAEVAEIVAGLINARAEQLRSVPDYRPDELIG
jgi:hypothetical protein